MLLGEMGSCRLRLLRIDSCKSAEALLALAPDCLRGVVNIVLSINVGHETCFGRTREDNGYK